MSQILETLVDALEDQLFITDFDNKRVQMFTPKREFLK